jgi:hypothetical protein
VPTKGQIIAIGFAAFALACGIVSLDYARGRVPETSSPLILDVLAGGAEKRCRRDVSDVAVKSLPVGMTRPDALRVINEAMTELPRPWFWTPRRTDSVGERPDGITASRMMRATAFGNEQLLIELGIRDGKVERVAARVECAFS